MTRVAFVDAGGVRTRFLVAGEGEEPEHPVVLVHGFGLTADSWIRTVDGLGERFTVYAPDCLGQGFTAPGALRPPVHQALVDHLWAFVGAVGAPKVSVVGSSFGAQLAILMALGTPARVDRIGVVGSGSLTGSEKELAAAYGRTRAAAVDDFEHLTLARMRARLERFCHRPEALADQVVLQQATSLALPWVQPSYFAILDGMADLTTSRPYRVVDRLEEIQVPVMALWGRHDPLGAYDRAPAFCDRVPDCRLVTFEDSGHLPYLEEPERFNSALATFLVSGPPGTTHGPRRGPATRSTPHR